ncbi:MAG: hypothetical protein RIR04_1534 [Pseudomonadota bacterium]
MAKGDPSHRKSGGWRDRFEMWRAGRKPVATGFENQPEPRSIGLYARGKQLMAGQFIVGGAVVEQPDTAIWDVPFADADVQRQTHGFGWLDDLAAMGSAKAQAKAQGWAFDWLARYGKGRGPGWQPQTVGRRLIRWINHAPLLLQGRSPADHAAFMASLSAQLHFLARRWPQATAGLNRVEALTAVITSGLVLTGLSAPVDPALSALAAHLEAEVDMGGGIASRNPEDLLDLFTLLTWVEQALAEVGRAIPPELLSAIERIAPVLRALRHADGGLARFHGGGRGAEGRLDAALANAGIKPLPSAGMAMGYVRLTGARTSIVVDAAPPAQGCALAHASLGAFELTSGRRPVVVSVGSGAAFGAKWRAAGRTTAAHSTLGVEDVSSSRLGPKGHGPFVTRADTTTLRLFPGETGAGVHLAHDGWAKSHGVVHVRDLMLTKGGRLLTGTDRLTATLDKRGAAQAAARKKGLPFTIRFHLHPDVDARLDMGGAAVSLTLKSGEIWVFRHDGSAKLALEPTIYLEKTRMRPRDSLQIVLSGTAWGLDSQLGWTLAKAQDTPLAIRDLEREDTASQI